MKEYLKPNIKIETIKCLDDVILSSSLTSKVFKGMDGESDVNEDWNKFWGN